MLAAPIAAVFALTLSTAARAATIVVNSLADPDATGICALRDAITAANTRAATNGCIAGTGNDTIQFSVTGTISLASKLPQVTDSRLAINGPASPGITIDGGGAVQVMQVALGATLNLKNLVIAHGILTPASAGGGILNEGTLTVTNCTFSGNFAGEGGGIFNSAGTLTVTNSTFFGNRSFAGGGIFNSAGTLTVTNSTFSGNSASSGGSIFNVGALAVTSSTFSSNSVGLEGGAIYNQGTTLTVTDSTFSDNIATDGGGISNFGPTRVANSTFSRNLAFSGGGISNLSGTLTIINSTFSGDSVAVRGAGIFNSRGTLFITNSTFSGNFAPFGGGISSFFSGSVSIKNTVLAGSSGGNCAGTITDADYNISDDATCGFSAIGSRNATNPMLDPAGLQDNGGPTDTIALGSESPAIDAIPAADCTDQSSSPKPITTDQRGMPRPDAGEDVCDIGAYESQETFAGQPGAVNCQSVSVSVLAHEFGTIDAAASALGFPSVKALQNAIRAFCRG